MTGEDVAPAAGVAPDASIRQRAPGGIGPAGCQVQSMPAPVPLPLPSSVPALSVTATRQAIEDERRAVKRIPPASSGAASGAYSFGRPSAAARFASEGSIA